MLYALKRRKISLFAPLGSSSFHTHTHTNQTKKEEKNNRVEYLWLLMRHSHLYWRVAQRAALIWHTQAKAEEGIISRGAFTSNSSSTQCSLTIGRSYLRVMQG